MASFVWGGTMSGNRQSWFTALIVFLCLGLGIKWLLANAGGSPGNRTGSPGDGGVSCSACHFGGTQSNGSFSISGLGDSTYTPGQVFNLTLTPSGPRGFEIVAERTDPNASVGAWTGGGNNRAVADGLTHNFSGASSWSFTWTAPNSNVGTIKIYVAGPTASAPSGLVHLKNFTLSPPPTPQISSLSPSFGSVNETITISGSNFGSSFSTVTFGGNATAPCSSWAGTAIICRVPNGAVSGNVTVTTSQGTSNGVNFNVITGAPAVGGISPSVGPSTSTSFSATISGQNLSPGATVQLTKAGASSITGSITSISASTSFAAVFNLFLAGSSTGQWSVAVTNPDSQSGTGADLLRIDKIPPAPAGFGGTALSASSIQWAWTDVADNEDGYRVLTSTDGRISPDLAADAVSYTESGLLPNQQASRKAQAFNPIGASTSSTATAFTLPNPPSDPAFASVFITSASVSWSANSNQGSPLYEVSLSTDGFLTSFSTPVVFASNLMATATALLNLTPATTTFFRVRAQGGGGDVSDFSQSVSSMTLPAAPAGLIFAIVSTDNLQLSWGKNGNPDSVQYVAELSTGSFPNGFSGNKSADTFLDNASFPGLLANTTYFARVKAQRSDGVESSAASNSTATLANVPGAMEITATSTTFIGFQYDANLNPPDTLYQVQLAASSDFTTLSHSFQIEGTSGQFSGLSENTTYYLRARARNRNDIFTDFNIFASSITRPGAPSGVFGTALGVSSISWTWDAIPGALSYNVYSSTGALSLSSNVSSNNFIQIGLSTNVVYSIRVSALNASGEGELSAPASTATFSASPANLAVDSRTDKTISISWDENTNPAGTRYEVSLSTDDFTLNFSTPIPLSRGLTGNTTTLFDLTSETDYWIRLRSFNASDLADGFSNTVTTRTFPTPPNAPADFSAVALSTISIRWSWTDNSDNEGGFRIYLSTGGLLSPDLAQNATDYTAPDLQVNTAYQAFVRAFGFSGVESEDSNVFTRWTLADPPGALAVAAVAGSSTSLKVFWSTGAASGYGLERSTFSSGGFAQIVSSSALTAQTSFYFDSGLSAKTTYFYRLRGFNGESAPTGYIGPEFDLTHPPLPQAPVLSGVAASTTSILWSWNIPEDTAGFALLTSTGGVIVYLAGNVSSHLEVDLSSGTSYTRQLKAINGTGASFSNLAAVSTPQDQQAVPASSSATIVAGSATVDIPAGALGGAGDVLISLDPRTNPLLDSTASDLAAADSGLSASIKPVPGAVGEFLAFVGGSRKTDNFVSQVTIAFSYPDSDNDDFVDGVSPPVRAGNLSVYTLNESLRRWEALSSEVNFSSKTVSAQAAHFSVFALFGAAASSNLSAIKVFPNPFQPGSGGAFDASGIKFKNLTQEATIRIFTLTGELVRTLHKTAADGDEKVWDARNESGRSVASGVYFYLVTNPSGEKIKGRVAVIK